MKALIFRETGEPKRVLKLAEIPTPPLAPGEALDTSWVFRRRLIPAGCSTTSGTRTGAGDEGERLEAGKCCTHSLNQTLRSVIR